MKPQRRDPLALVLVLVLFLVGAVFAPHDIQDGPESTGGVLDTPRIGEES